MKNINKEALLVVGLRFVTSSFLFMAFAALIISMFVTIPISTVKILLIIITSAGGYLITSLYLRFFELITALNKIINVSQEVLTAATTYINNPLKQTNQNPTNVEQIIITDETSPEEMDEIKKQHPFLSPQLDEIFKQFQGSNPFSKLTKQKEKQLIDMSIEELEEALEKAVGENKFEKAAIIRDELKTRQ